jgi:hypothetical protein
VTITDEQYAGLEACKQAGVPVSVQVRKALDRHIRCTKTLAAKIAIAVDAFDSEDFGTLVKTLRNLLEEDDGKNVQLTVNASAALQQSIIEAARETILSEEEALEFAQKIGKPLEELYERVPAQKSSAEIPLEGLEIL